MNIDASSSALKEMENSMLLNEDVIRSLSIKVSKLEEGPSVMMKSKDDKEVKLNFTNNSDGDFSNQYTNNLNMDEWWIINLVIFLKEGNLALFQE